MTEEIQERSNGDALSQSIAQCIARHVQRLESSGDAGANEFMFLLPLPQSIFILSHSFAFSSLQLSRIPSTSSARSLFPHSTPQAPGHSGLQYRY
jgi:hypothetical protein